MSRRNLSSSKSILGKLLASENIRIEHQNIETAYFDVGKRLLALPNWKEMDKDLYDLLIGHEVGHALYTPAEGWQDEIAEHGMELKHFLNVVEDARIEKLMRNRYPGLRGPMYQGYTQLMDRNFFGVEMEEMNYLPFVDRLNIFFKLGSRSNIEFNPEEKNFIDRVADAEDWDQVVELSIELMEITKNEKEEISSLFDDIKNDGEDEDGGTGEYTWSDDPGGSQDDEKIDFKDLPEEVQEKLLDWAKSEDNAPITERNFEERKSTLNHEHGIVFRNVIYPEIKNFNDWIIPAKEVNANYNFSDNIESIRESTYNEFLSRNKSYISYIIKEFELRKKAKQLSKASTGKTGKLNMDKVWSHKISDNIFLQNTILPDGKNHGMLMLMDMSSSMEGIIKSTIEQVVILAMFCKKINIPFEVYGFYDNYAHEHSKDLREYNDPREDSLQITSWGFHLKEFINNRMNQNEYKNAVSNLLMYGECFRNRWSRYSFNTVMNLGSTPLAESVLILEKIANRFKKNTGIDVLNTIILTDGENTGSLGTRQDIRSVRTCAIQDLNTGTVSRVLNKAVMPNALLDIYKKRTGSNVIGFYLLSSNTNAKNSIKKQMHLFDRIGALEEFSSSLIDKKFEQEYKKNNYFSVDNMRGYDAYYIIPGGNLKVEDTDLGNILSSYKNQESKASILRAFKKTQNKKNISRVFLNNFVEQIS